MKLFAPSDYILWCYLGRRSLSIGRMISFACIVSVLVVLPAALWAQMPCIANYATDQGVVSRDEHEEGRLFASMSDELRQVVDWRLEEGLSGYGWQMPFRQARYDDLIFTLSLLEDLHGPELTPSLRAKVVEQFMSPVAIRNGELSELILSDIEPVQLLLQRHVGAYKFWQQFGLCAFHSPYAFYDTLHKQAFHAAQSGSSSFDRAAYRLDYASIPMRSLGGELLFVRRGYLPDPTAPRVRFVAPPCEQDLLARSLVYQFDSGSNTWIAVEPYLEVGTWYLRGFEDPLSTDSPEGAPATPRDFFAQQRAAGQRFEELQQGLGLPVQLPLNVDITCE